ncbi:candidate inclusion membrane protein [Chlamydia trachomatis]|nr:candidate inclusion membrane protein [Chlamydia trachomatis]
MIRNSDQLLQEAKESARKISSHYRVLETQKNREIGLLEERVNMLDGFYAKFHGWD